MKPTSVILVVLIVAIVMIVGLFAYLGFISIPGLDIRDDNTSPGALNCDYTDQQILDMIGTISSKNLDSAVGLPFVRALNMQVCGSDETSSEVVEYYTELWIDWYLIETSTSTGSGWISRNVVWGNEQAIHNSTYINAIMVFTGVSVDTTYGYDTMTLSGDGTQITYAAFILWLNAS